MIRNYEGTAERGTVRDPETDDVMMALAKPMRRRALSYLDDAGGAVPLDELAAHLADDPADREDAAVALHHAHLPRLADCGLVEYDYEENRATATVPPRVAPLLELTD